MLCDDIASYGIPIAGEKCRTHCVKHRLAGSIRYRTTHRRCVYPDCHEIPTYGDVGSRYMFCGSHRRPEDVDLTCKICSSCGFVGPIDAYTLCEYCALRANRPHVPTRLYRQRIVLESLRRSGLEPIAVDRAVVGSPVKYRPDAYFRAEVFGQTVSIEVDEDQHESYCPRNEAERMNDLHSAYQTTKSLFIRFNPDDYRSNNKAMDMQDRLLALSRVVRHWIETPLPEEAPIRVVRMFFDGEDFSSWKRPVALAEDLQNRLARNTVS